LQDRILIIGATGLLGCVLSHRLSRAGHSVVRHGSSVQADINADLRKSEDTHALLDRVRPTTIVNLVAMTDVDACEQRPQDAFLVNVHTSENIVAWIKRNSKVQLVQISTDQVYDGPGPHPENDVTLLNIYAYSKYCCECVAASVGATILRTNFFGRVRHTRKSFSEWIVERLEKGSDLRMVTDVLFSPLHVATLCDVIDHVLMRPKAGIYNLGSRGGTSKYEFGRNVAKLLGYDPNMIRAVSVADLGLLARRPRDMRMDVTLFETEFNMKLPNLESQIEMVGIEYGK
jgi:dTDP-4-dehydrorhamnose reductase